jgi:hypothetical protein
MAPGPDNAPDLFENLSETGDSAEMVALITEACRIKRRLDQLDRLIGGDDELWMRLITARGGDEAVLEVKIDSALSEARQLATVFRQMLAEVARRRREDGKPDDDDPLARL